jgi:ABC-type dipeptide/oligopeptide/nickel transport system ATPase subunit
VNYSKPILQNISFEIEKLSIVGIVGYSGCGKTTLAKIISGIITNYSGEINFNFDQKVKNSNQVQLLFQNSAEIVNPLRKVGEVLNEALEINKSAKRFINKISDLLNILKLNENILDKYCYQLSGGERQRVALGRILAVEPEMLLFDEPFSAQDLESQVNLFNILSNLRNILNVTILCISHNLQILDKLTDNLIVMNEGKIVEIGNTKKIIGSPDDEFTKLFVKTAYLEINQNNTAPKIL